MTRRDRDIYGRVPTRTSVFLRRNVGFCIAVPWCLYAFSSYFMDFDGYWKRIAEKKRFEIKEATRDLDSVRQMREEMEHSVMRFQAEVTSENAKSNGNTGV